MYSGNKNKTAVTDDQSAALLIRGQNLDVPPCGTVHNWRVESSLAHETRESCNGHCQATCRRDKRTGLLIAFDAEGQKPRTYREFIAGVNATVPIDPTPLGEIW